MIEELSNTAAAKCHFTFTTFYHVQYTKKVFVQKKHVRQRVASYDVSPMLVLIFSRVGGTETARGVGFLFVELVPLVEKCLPRGT